MMMINMRKQGTLTSLVVKNMTLTIIWIDAFTISLGSGKE